MIWIPKFQKWFESNWKTKSFNLDAGGVNNVFGDFGTIWAYQQRKLSVEFNYVERWWSKAEKHLISMESFISQVIEIYDDGQFTIMLSKNRYLSFLHYYTTIMFIVCFSSLIIIVRHWDKGNMTSSNVIM